MSEWSWEGTDYSKALFSWFLWLSSQATSQLSGYITMTIVTGNDTFPDQNITKDVLLDQDDQVFPNLFAEINPEIVCSLISPVQVVANSTASALGSVMLAIVFGIIAFTTVVGNIMVMVSFKMDKQLQTISNYFLFR
jgi:hypothetical protein